MIKSIVIAYKTGEDNHISVRRCFDIKRNRIITVDSIVSEHPEITSISLPKNIYNKLEDNDLLAIEWEGNYASDDDTILTNVTNSNIEDKIYEILDLDVNSKELVDTLKSGFELPYKLQDKFYILAGLEDQNNKVVIACDIKYFNVSSNTYKLKESYNNKPVILLKKCKIAKEDIIKLDSSVTGLRNSRYLYRFTDTEDIKAYDDLIVDNGVKLLINYFKNVLENRKVELNITHREIQGFQARLINALKENEDALQYLIDMGYPYEVAEKAIETSESLIEQTIMESDSNSELVKRVITESQKLQDMYFPMIEKKYEEANKEKIAGFEEQINVKKTELNKINKELVDAEQRLKIINEDIANALERQKSISSEIKIYDEGLQQKVSDFVLNSAFLSKYLGTQKTNTVQDIVNSNPHGYIEGTNVERRKTDFSGLQLNLPELITKHLGISINERTNFAQLVYNTYSLNMNYIIDSYQSKEFASFLSIFIGKRSYDTIFVDDSASISSLNNLITNESQVVLVKNALNLVNTKYVEYMSLKYDKVTFVFEIADNSNIKYLPKSFWKTNFYIYYKNKVSPNNYVEPKEYMTVDFKTISFSTKDNVNVIAESLHLDIDNEDYLGNERNTVDLLIKQYSLVKLNGKVPSLNPFYICQLLIIFNSIGLDLNSFKYSEDELLEKYVSSIIFE